MAPTRYATTRPRQFVADALRWAFATLTIVGYGQRFSVTVVGRTVAVG